MALSHVLCLLQLPHWDGFLPAKGTMLCSLLLDQTCKIPEKMFEIHTHFILKKINMKSTWMLNGFKW